MYACTPRSHDKWYGIIAIAYFEHKRSCYDKFSSVDFDLQIELKAIPKSAF